MQRILHTESLMVLAVCPHSCCCTWCPLWDRWPCSRWHIWKCLWVQSYADAASSKRRRPRRNLTPALGSREPGWEPRGFFLWAALPVSQLQQTSGEILRLHEVQGSVCFMNRNKPILVRIDRKSRMTLFTKTPTLVLSFEESEGRDWRMLAMLILLLQANIPLSLITFFLSSAIFCNWCSNDEEHPFVPWVLEKSLLEPWSRRFESSLLC